MMTYLKFISLRKKDISITGKWLFSKILTEKLNIHFSVPRGLFPILVQHTGNSYELIWGYEQLKDLSPESKVEAISVRASDLDKGLLNLYTMPGMFDTPEKYIICFRYFYEILPKDEFQRYIKSIFKEILDKKDINNLIKWLELDIAFDDILIYRNLSLDLVNYLLKFSHKDCNFILPFFKNIKWGKNKAKSFLNCLYILHKREKKEIKYILTPIYNILEKDLSPNDKIKNILDVLRDRTYPNIREIEREFYKKTSSLIKKNIKIFPSTGFELDEISMEIRFKENYTPMDFFNDLKIDIDKLNEIFVWYITRLKDI